MHAGEPREAAGLRRHRQHYRSTQMKFIDNVFGAPRSVLRRATLDLSKRCGAVRPEPLLDGIHLVMMIRLPSLLSR